ncbi:MAG: hypothetical protein ACKO7N_09190 [Candidatus Nitrosotenuis sp.]
MGFLLNSTQMSNGEFWGGLGSSYKTLWDYNLSQTRRRIISISTTRGTNSGTITFGLVNSTLNKNPFAATTSTQTDIVKITNIQGLNGNYPIASVGTNSITIKVSLSTLDSGPFNTTLQSMATRITKGLLDKPETRNLSSLKWRWNLGSTQSPYPMCDMQNQIYDFLMQFWSDPEIVQEWKAKYKANETTWNQDSTQGGWGPTSTFFGGSNKLFDLDVMVKWWLCTVYSESTWKASSYSALGDPSTKYLTKTEALQPYDSWPTSNRPCGLWQIGARAGANWWKSSSETATQFARKTDHLDMSRAFNREYNTRAAVWIMFQLLFNTNTKPFAYWGSSNYYNTNNTKMKTCYDQSPTNFMQVGTTSIICEDFK